MTREMTSRKLNDHYLIANKIRLKNHKNRDRH